MRAPAQPPDGVVVAREHGQGPLGRGSDIEGADGAVDACGREDGGAVFVPVVGKGFGGGDCCRC